MSSKSAYGEPSNFQLAGPLARFSLARSLLGKGLTAGLVSLCLGSVSFADDWNVQGIVSGEILYDDNIRLDAEDNREISTFGGGEQATSGLGVRWLMIDAALQMFQDVGLMGSGLYTFSLLYPQYRSLDDQSTTEAG